MNYGQTAVLAEMPVGYGLIQAVFILCHMWSSVPLQLEVCKLFSVYAAVCRAESNEVIQATLMLFCSTQRVVLAYNSCCDLQMTFQMTI